MKTLIITLTMAACLALGSVATYGMSKSDIKIAAREASVQILEIVPVMRVSFTKPADTEKAQTTEELKEEMKELLAQEIKDAIKQARVDAEEPKHLTTLTTFEKYGVQSKSRQEIALGAIAPEWAKWPKRVLVVSRIDKKDINAYDEAFDKDVLAISETTGVSASKAKAMLKKLASEGYQVTKDTVEPEAEVVLLHFGYWEDSYPTTLKWEVKCDGVSVPIIGYDPRGILKVQPIPEDDDGDIKRVYVKAGYFDLKEKFKPKTNLEDSLQNEKEVLEERIKQLEKKLEGPPDKPYKRDITKATMYDVQYGRVLLEEFYMKSGGTGCYLGTMQVSKEMSGFAYGGYHSMTSKYKSVILTNSHVASAMYSFHIYVSDDKEVMYIIFPAYGFIRFTQDSDSFGSPAAILAIDGSLVDSMDNDAAILVTSRVPSLERYAAKFGDSSKVKEGTEVCSVGNPMMVQSMLTVGVVSNVNYSALKSPLADGWLAEGMSRQEFEWISASTMWVDTTIGIGGVSGSGLFALEGRQAGKLIGLRNMGMMSSHAIATPTATQKIDQTYLGDMLPSGPVRSVMKKHYKTVFDGFDYKKAIFNTPLKNFTGPDETLQTIFHVGSRHSVAGMNGAIPINSIIEFLSERGLPVEDWGAKELDGKYWQK